MFNVIFAYNTPNFNYICKSGSTCKIQQCEFLKSLFSDLFNKTSSFQCNKIHTAEYSCESRSINIINIYIIITELSPK